MADTQYEGTPIYMAGKVWIVPGLSVKQFRRYFPVLAKSQSMPADATLDQQAQAINESLDERLPAILAAMQRNYPDLTQEQLEDMLDAGNVVEIVKAMSKGSGLRAAKPGE